MNKVMMIGRLCHNPELKQTTNGTLFTNVRIAIDNGRDNPATFVNCTAWKNTAENLVKFFHKGDRIGISGALKSRQWDDKDGNKRESLEVFIETFDFCNDRKQSGQQTAPAYTEPTPEPQGEGLPFEI